MGITDHLTTCILLPFQHKNHQIEKIKISFRDCSTVNDNTFENKLRNFNWNEIKSYDPEIYLQNFISSLNLLFQESYPLKTKFVTQRYFSNPWYSKDVNKISDARKNYHNLYHLNLVSREQYTAYRNKITHLIRKCKENFYMESFKRNSGNMKKTWGTIRELSKGKINHTSTDEIYYNGIYYRENNEITEIFNRYFVTIAHDLAAALPPPVHSPYLYVQPNTNQSIELHPVTSVEVSSIISSLKITKTNVNEISVTILKKYQLLFELFM